MDEAVRIAFDAGLPYAGLRDFRPDAALWTAVAPDWAHRERAVPLALAGGRLTLATAQPTLDLSGLGRDYAAVDLVIAPADEIDAALAALAAAGAGAAGAAGAEAAGAAGAEAAGAAGAAGAEADARPPRAPVTDPSSPRRLGDLLVAHGVTTDEAIAEALEEQARTGGLLGDVLLAREAVPEERLRTVLAEQLGLPVVDLAGYEPDADALALVPERLQRRLRCVPLAVDDAAIYVAVADPLDAEQLATLGDGAGGREPRCFLAARETVDDLLQALHAEEWAARVRAGVAARFPEESCAGPVPPAIVVALVLALLAAVAGLALAPAAAATVLVALAASVTALPALLALLVAAAGLRRAHPAAMRDGEPAAGLPLTTLLLPLGGGAGAVGRGAATLAALDHPRARLEVLLLCPAQDLPGLRAARELTRRRPHRLVVVPADVPPGRAAMLAYGLLLARGTYVAVLDPGDVPAPGLLRAAGTALHAGGRRVGAAQAALTPPSGGGLAGAWTAAQRAAWHELLAPGLARLGLPLPLASTGVVLCRDVLEDVAAWDPACAAEGIDLGLRLHKSGFRATTVGVAVGTAAPAAHPTWLRAQARWWRGALDTWLVQLRHPWRAVRRMGLPSTAATAAIGLAAVAAPVVWLPVVVLAAVGALQELGVLSATPLPETVIRLAGAQVLVVSAVLILLAVGGAVRCRSAKAARTAPLAPIGFTIASLGSWLGIAGLIAGTKVPGPRCQAP